MAGTAWVRVDVHPRAEREIERAIAHLRANRSESLAEAFADEVDRFIGMVLENPLIGKPHPAGAREFVMGRFSYTVVYNVDDTSVLVLAMSHHRRRPSYWVRRLTWKGRDVHG